MYLGWSFGGRVSRSKKKGTVKAGFSFLSKDAICLMIESVIMTAEGEKLKDAPGEFGAGSLQLTAQHNCAALILSEPLQSVIFFLQHSIADMPFCALPENGVAPASAPAASAKSKTRDVSHLFIDFLRLFLLLDTCQAIETSIYTPMPLAFSVASSTPRPVQQSASLPPTAIAGTLWTP
jgi:hypothetical protein